MRSRAAFPRAEELPGILRPSCALFDAQDDVADLSESGGAFEIRQATWQLMADVADAHPACVRALEGVFEGLGAGCGRGIAVDMRPAAGGGPPFVWSIG